MSNSSFITRYAHNAVYLLNQKLSCRPPSAATEPSKQVDITLHFLEFLLVTLSCSPIPLAVTLKLLPMVRFSVKFMSDLVGGKIICWRWRCG